VEKGRKQPLRESENGKCNALCTKFSTRGMTLKKTSKPAISVEPMKYFQNKTVKENEDLINYPQGFPQDVENC
jgi:hypothetical protein